MDEFYQLPIARIKGLIDFRLAEMVFAIDTNVVFNEYKLSAQEAELYNAKFSVNCIAAVKIHVLNCAIDLAYSDYFDWVKESKYTELRHPVEVEGRYNDEIKHISELINKADKKMAKELSALLYGLESKNSHHYALVPMVKEDLSKILKNVVEHVSQLNTNLSGFKFDDNTALSILFTIEEAANELIEILNRSPIPVDSVLYSDVRGDILVLQRKLNDRTSKTLSFNEIRAESKRSLSSIVGSQLNINKVMALTDEQLQIVLQRRARNESDYLKSLFATKKFRAIIEQADEIESLSLSPEIDADQVIELVVSLVAELRNAQYSWRAK